MKITRHTAPDMRQALRAVRDQLGPDAVILSSRRTPTGVEVTAAMDFDAEASIAAAETAEASRDTTREVPRESATGASHALATPATQSAPLAAFASTAVAGGGLAATPQAPAAQPSASDSMSEELKTLRRMLETQLAQLAWNDLARRAPVHTEMLRELTEIGIAQGLAAEVVAHMPADVELTQARRLAIAMIAQRLLVTGDRWLENGGRVALVGLDGRREDDDAREARRTLGAAPRRARSCARRSRHVCASAHKTRCRRSGSCWACRCYSARRLWRAAATAHPALRATASSSSTRPGRANATYSSPDAWRSSSGEDREIETALVLAASTQAGAVEEAVRRFACARPASCVLTKVDEATSLGGALSALIDARLAHLLSERRSARSGGPASGARARARRQRRSARASQTARPPMRICCKRRFGEVAHALA